MPRVNAVNNNKIGINNKVSGPIFKPNININAVNGINVNPRFISEATCAESGKAITGTFIDFKTPELFIIDSIIWIVLVEKKIQNTNPVRANRGYLSILGKALLNTTENIVRYIMGFIILHKNPNIEFLYLSLMVLRAKVLTNPKNL